MVSRRGGFTRDRITVERCRVVRGAMRGDDGRERARAMVRRRGINERGVRSWRGGASAYYAAAPGADSDTCVSRSAASVTAILAASPARMRISILLSTPVFLSLKLKIAD